MAKGPDVATVGGGPISVNGVILIWAGSGGAGSSTGVGGAGPREIGAVLKPGPVLNEGAAPSD